MAASKGYTIFGGLAETLGGVLLLIPRLSNLGALVSVGVLVNVFALNMSYDVPVKIFSFHLLLMAVFLAAPDLPRLAMCWSSTAQCRQRPRLRYPREAGSVVQRP